MSKYYYNPYSLKTSWETPVGYIDRNKEAKIAAAKEADLREHGLMQKVKDGHGLDNEEDMEVSEGLPDVLKKDVIDTMDDMLEVEPTLSTLKRGQLRVCVEQAKKIYGNDKSLQCYVILKLAESTNKKFKKKTKTTEVVTNGNPKFDETFR